MWNLSLAHRHHTSSLRAIYIWITWLENASALTIIYAAPGLSNPTMSRKLWLSTWTSGKYCKKMCLAQTIFKFSLFNTYNNFFLESLPDICTNEKKITLPQLNFFKVWQFLFFKWMFNKISCAISWLENVGSFTWSRFSVWLWKNIHNTPPVVQSPLSYCL